MRVQWPLLIAAEFFEPLLWTLHIFRAVERLQRFRSSIDFSNCVQISKNPSLDFLARDKNAKITLNSRWTDYSINNRFAPLLLTGTIRIVANYEPTTAERR